MKLLLTYQKLQNNRLRKHLNNKIYCMTGLNVIYFEISSALEIMDENWSLFNIK